MTASPNVSQGARLRRTGAAGWLAALCLAACFGGPIAGRAAAEDAYVKSNEVVVRAGKGPIYEAVTTVRRGAKVHVLEKQGKWWRVSANGREGWVYETAMSSRSLDGERIAAGGNAAAGGIGLGAAGSGLKGQTVEGAELALAGGGGGGAWDAAQSAARSGLNPAGLQQLKSARATVTAQAVQAFGAEGNVGLK